MKKIHKGKIDELINGFLTNKDLEEVHLFRTYLARAEDPKYIHEHVYSHLNEQPMFYEMMADDLKIYYVLLDASERALNSVIQRPRVEGDPDEKFIPRRTRFGNTRRALESLAVVMDRLERNLNAALNNHPSKQIAMDVIRKAKEKQ